MALWNDGSCQTLWTGNLTICANLLRTYSHSVLNLEVRIKLVWKEVHKYPVWTVLLSFLFFFFFVYYCVCTCHGTYVEGRGQLWGVSSLFPVSHGLWENNLRLIQQTPWLREPPHRPRSNGSNWDWLAFQASSAVSENLFGGWTRGRRSSRALVGRS